MNVFDMLEAVKGLEGDYAECGVWLGCMAEKIYTGMDKSATLWLFDSFKGHAKPTEYDDAAHHPEGRYKDASYDSIKLLCPDAMVVPEYIGWDWNAFKLV